MSDNTRIYERLKDETDKAFRAFNIFLELGPDRRLSDVAARLSVSKQNLQRWNGKYKWVERAAAYDNYIQKSLTVATIEQEIDIRSQMNRNLMLSLKSQEKEILIKMRDQDRALQDSEYEYRPSSNRTIAEAGKLTMEHLNFLEPPDKQEEQPGDLFLLIKQAKEINASSGR